MLKVSNLKVMGWEGALRGMRNPMNSWNLSDSYSTYIEDVDTAQTAEFEFFIGENDLKLAKNLVSTGKDHRKFLRMVHIQMDILAPLYWWKEYDTYKVATTANSTSTMHRIHKKEFTLDDFSTEHLISDLCEDIPDSIGESIIDYDGNLCAVTAMDLLSMTVRLLNAYRDQYLDTREKKYWWQMIQLLPSSYNQLRTIDIDYETALSMYHARHLHKLDEWHTLCNAFEQLPYFNEFIREEK